MMMGLTAVAALLATTARSAGDGGTFAKAFLVLAAVPLLFFLLAGLAFLLSLVTAHLVLGKVANSLQGNPFAEQQLPPQQLKPRDPTL